MGQEDTHSPQIGANGLLPEQSARVRIDSMLRDAGWEIVPRDGYTPGVSAAAIEEGLLQGNLEADYLLFLEGKAIGVLEAKKESSSLSVIVASQAENYTHQLLSMYQYWENPLPFIYLSNGKELLFRNLKDPDGKYQPLKKMHSPKEMAKLAGITSYFIGLPRLEKAGLRKCQIDAITNLEATFRNGQQRALISVATGAGKTLLSCLAAYRFLTYTPARRILFLVDRNNLGKQANGEFGIFDKTETGAPFTSIYETSRWTAAEFKIGSDGKVKIPDANLVICTIQRLYSVITGMELQTLDDSDSPLEEQQDGPAVELTGPLHLPPDYFDFIFVDECHRSIYGRWKKVLTYFDHARIIGLTATPGEETMAFFNNNRIVNYTLEESVADGINVGYRIYNIDTEATMNGGIVGEGDKYQQITVYTGQRRNTRTVIPWSYESSELDRDVVNPEQIRLILETFRDAIYEDLYPNRTPDFASIPKTLIFAKSDSHADNILSILREVFPGQVPEFAQKITYSAGDSNTLINNFRNDRKFRIAVTVTLVATGTDVKPLEILLFMRDVNTEPLFIQMRGRGCRKIPEDALRNVTPNADTKDHFTIVDAVGVTRHPMKNKPIGGDDGDRIVPISLEKLLEQITHGWLPDDNLILLAKRLVRIHDRYREAQHKKFAALSGMDMIDMAKSIQDASDSGQLAAEPFVHPNEPNLLRKALVQPLSLHVEARKYLLELNSGYVNILQPGKDRVVGKGFSKEKALETTTEFETYLQQHRDEEEVIRIVAKQLDSAITYDMLADLAGKLKAYNFEFQPATLWYAYSVLDPEKVVPLKAEDKDAQTNLIQLMRFALGGHPGKLQSLRSLSAQRFELWCGEPQRKVLTDVQRQLTLELTNYIVCNGACTPLNISNGIGPQFLMQVRSAFGPKNVDTLLKSLSAFMLAA